MLLKGTVVTLPSFSISGVIYQLRKCKLKIEKIADVYMTGVCIIPPVIQTSNFSPLLLMDDLHSYARD